ncbi:MAG: HlyD family efflux transporter periplasmic adaptor subunit [Eubacteriaceae bacterium]
MAKRRRKRKKTIYIYLGFITLAVLLWVNYNSKKVQTLYVENYINTYETKATVIKNEAFLNLNDKIDIATNKGERISLNTILASSDSIKYADYYNREIDIINWIIDNEAYNETNLFNDDLKDIDENLDDVESRIEKTKDASKLEELENEKKELLEKKSYIVESFQFIGLNKETLLDLKSQYSSYDDTSGSNISLKKLNFTFPGFIYFQTDGYESLLNKKILEYLTPEYLENIEEYNKNDYNSSYKQTIKIIDDSFIYFCIILPEDIQLSQEEKVLEKKESIMSNLNTQSLNDYYDYLNKRIDILRTFPKIEFEYNKNKNNGYIIDVRNYGKNKIVIVELKEKIEKDYIEKRQLDISIYTYNKSGYVIPKKSVTQVDGKDNIVVLNKGYLRTYVEVTVAMQDEDKAFLKKSDNENIKDGMQLIINP